MKAAPWMTIVLVSVMFAGCMSGDTDDPSSVDADPQLIHTLDAAAIDAQAPFSTFLCRDGFHLADDIADGAIDRCNHRVTKPLLDPEWFNVVDQHGPANEVSIAVNPLDPLNAAGGGKDYTVSYVSDDARCGEYTVWMGTYATHDGGITWTNDLMPGFAGDQRESPLHGQFCNTDPVLAYDDDGTLWFQALNYNGARKDDSSAGESNPLYPGSQNDAFSGSQIYFVTSSDGGITYGDFSFAVEGDGDSIFHDKQWFALQPGGDHVIATWSMFFSTPPAPDEVPDAIAEQAAFGNDIVMFVESFDNGATWSEMQSFPAGDASNVDLQFSMPQYLPDPDLTDQEPDVAVIWAEFGRSDTRGGTGVEDQARLAYTEGVTTEQGSAFEPATTAFMFNAVDNLPGRDGSGPSHFRWSTYPVLAIDTSGGEFDGRRYVAWADQAGSVDTDVELLMRYSDDGETWSEPVTINDVAHGDQFMVWIDVDSEGGLHASWYDRRNDPTNENIDVYYAYSDNGGESFYPNVRVTETSFNGDLGHHQSGAPFIGDYNGLDATPEAAYIMWADTRHTGVDGMGRPAGSDVYSATILRGSDAISTFEAAFR